MGLFGLLVLGGVMFVGSFLIGLLPLSISLNPRRQKFLSAYGIGLLIGTALIVIIPEGIHTYQLEQAKECQIQPHSHAHSHSPAQPPSASVPSSAPDSAAAQFLPEFDFTTPEAAPSEGAAAHTDSDSESHEDHAHSHSAAAAAADADVDSASSHSRSDCESSSLSPIGLALGFGFIFMLLVDRFSSPDSISPVVAAVARPGLNRPREPASADTDTEAESEPFVRYRKPEDIELESQTAAAPSIPGAVSPSQESSNRALIGILVHSAVDGIALGAISLTDNAALEMVVFLAIILHKAPAAFGLVSFLLAQGRTPRSVRFSLALFSAAAPIAALATFVLFVSQDPSRPSPISRSTLGLLLLFSGGTFLFTIALHILPELNSLNDREDGKLETPTPNSSHSHSHSITHAHSHSSSNSTSSASASASAPPSWRYVFAIIAGILSPTALALAPHHH